MVTLTFLLFKLYSKKYTLQVNKKFYNNLRYQDQLNIGKFV